MDTRGKAPVTAYVNVGVHADVPIEYRLDPDEPNGAEIHLGVNAELTMDFAEVESLERLRDVAAEAARVWRDSEARTRLLAARIADEQAGVLAGAGVAG